MSIVLQPLTGMGESPTGGRFLLCTCESLNDLVKLPTSLRFALLTALDLSSADPREMIEVAKELVGRGLSYACCWGEGCKRWHDMIDAADIERIESEGGDYRDVVMTSWHNDESLEDTLEYFKFSALPTDGYATDCIDYVIATPKQNEAIVRGYFSEIAVERGK